MRSLFLKSKNRNKALIGAGLLGFLIIFLFQSKALNQGAGNEGETLILLVSSLHGAHSENVNYPYDALYQLVDDFGPDYVGIEIRPEDMDRDEAYLSKNYPREMIALKDKYSSRSFGFDWLGEEIEGLPIPDDYWQTNQYVGYLRDMNADEAFQSVKPRELDTISERQMELVMTASPAKLMDGEYGRLTRQMDALEKSWYEGSPYAYVAQFNEKRDEIIGANIVDFIRVHEGMKIALIMGADHRTFAQENIEKALGSGVQFAAIQNESE